VARPASRSGARCSSCTADNVADCAFCAVVNGAEDHAVYRDPDVVAFLDHAPVFPGHTLVVPARHYDTLDDVPEDDLAPLFVLARRLSIAFRTALGAGGSFVAVNTRISQSVPHVHVHVVPRRKGDGLFSPGKGMWMRRRYSGNEAEVIA
jgi:histidine triad (HIT) family protein